MSHGTGFEIIESKDRFVLALCLIILFTFIIGIVTGMIINSNECEECLECDWCKDIHDKCPEEIKAECETGDYFEFQEEFIKIQEFWLMKGEHICDEQQAFLDFYCEGY